jgi:hypothetical protein
MGMWASVASRVWANVDGRNKSGHDGGTSDFVKWQELRDSNPDIRCRYRSGRSPTAGCGEHRGFDGERCGRMAGVEGFEPGYLMPIPLRT